MLSPCDWTLRCGGDTVFCCHALSSLSPMPHPGPTYRQWSKIWACGWLEPLIFLFFSANLVSGRLTFMGLQSVTEAQTFTLRSPVGYPGLLFLSSSPWWILSSRSCLSLLAGHCRLWLPLWVNLQMQVYEETRRQENGLEVRSLCLNFSHVTHPGQVAWSP